MSRARRRRSLRKLDDWQKNWELISLVQGTGAAGEDPCIRRGVCGESQGASDASASDSASMQESGNIEMPTAVGRLMAERTTQSWTTVPHFFLTRDVDASALNSYRERVLPGDGALACCPGHAYRSAGCFGRPRTVEASAPEC